MNEPYIEELLKLITNQDDGPYYILEIYHAIIEYIKSGNAIKDMGHPHFYFGATGHNDSSFDSTYSPTLPIFQLAKACSNYLKHFDTRLIWYRDLSTWENFCKFVMEINQINFFKRNRRLIISYKYYLRKKECPSCGIQQIDYFGNEDKIFLTKKENRIFIDCRRCGKYVLTTACFKYLDDFEKKSKLYVFLATRPEKEREKNITPKILKEILQYISFGT